MGLFGSLFVFDARGCSATGARLAGSALAGAGRRFRGSDCEKYVSVKSVFGGVQYPTGLFSPLGRGEGAEKRPGASGNDLAK